MKPFQGIMQRSAVHTSIDTYFMLLWIRDTQHAYTELRTPFDGAGLKCKLL